MSMNLCCFLFGKSEHPSADLRLMHFHRLDDERARCFLLHGSALPGSETRHGGRASQFLDQGTRHDDSAFYVCCLVCSRFAHLRCPRWQREWRGYLHFVLGAGRVRHLSDRDQRLDGGHRLLLSRPRWCAVFCARRTERSPHSVWREAFGPSRRASMPLGISPGSTNPDCRMGMGLRRKAFSGTPTGTSSSSMRPRPTMLWAAEPVSISDFGEIAGTYIAAGPGVFTRSGAGVLTNIQVPDGGSAVATAINASGSVVGYSFG